MAAFHQHRNINPLHVDVECRWQAKILQLFQKKMKSKFFIAIVGFSIKNCIQMSTNKSSIGAVVLEIVPRNQRKCMKFSTFVQ